MGLNRLWNLNFSVQQLGEVAATLGSDVPFFLHGPSSVCTSRGEVVQPVEPPTANWAVLILPGMQLSTPAVYRRFDEMLVAGNDRPDGRDQPDWRQWAQLSARLLLPRLINDLEAPAFSLQPALGELREKIETLLDRPVRMSGSGSSLFTLFDAREEAESSAGEIASMCRVRTHAAELAPQIKEDSTFQQRNDPQGAL